MSSRFLACHLSRPVLEHVLQKRGTVSLVFFCFCASCGIPASVLLCHPCTNREVESSCIGVRRTGSRAVLSLAHQEKCCVFASFIVILFGVVLRILVYRTVPAWKTLPRTSLCLRTLSSANPCLLCTSRSAESFLWSICVLCEVRDLFDPGFSAHSVRCEQVLSFLANSGSSAISCSRHLVTCLRVFVVCENLSLFRDPLVNLERRTLVDLRWCTCYIPGVWDQTETAFRLGQDFQSHYHLIWKYF